MSEITKTVTPMASDAKKPLSIKTQPTAWKNVELKSELPVVFEWRGVKYVTEELSDLDLEKLAKDKAFGHIEKKA